MLQIRSKLEQSAVVWHNSLTQKNKKDLERVQKSALKIILRDKYINYENALNVIVFFLFNNIFCFSSTGKTKDFIHWEKCKNATR